MQPCYTVWYLADAQPAADAPVAVTHAILARSAAAPAARAAQQLQSALLTPCKAALEWTGVGLDGNGTFPGPGTTVSQPIERPRGRGGAPKSDAGFGAGAAPQPAQPSQGRMAPTGGGV